MDTAGFIRDARIRAGFTQQHLAARAGTSQAAIARYEAGTVSPSVATLERLTIACGQRLALTPKPLRANQQTSQLTEQLREHRQEVLAQAHRLGIRNVRIFGSVARGEDTDASDIDLLVAYPAHKSLVPTLEFAEFVENLIGRKVDVAPECLLKPEVRAEALADSIPL